MTPGTRDQVGDPLAGALAAFMATEVAGGYAAPTPRGDPPGPFPAVSGEPAPNGAHP